MLKKKLAQMPPENFWGSSYQNGDKNNVFRRCPGVSDDVAVQVCSCDDLLQFCDKMNCLQMEYLTAQFVKDRLRLNGLLTRKISIPVNVLPSAAVRHTLAIITRMAAELERLHPRTFLNTSLALPETAPIIVENIGRSLFKHNDVNWGKIICFMTVSSAIACDCVRAGQPDIVQSIVDQTFAVLSDDAGTWIDKEGGFEALKEHIRPVGSEHITFLGWLGLLTGFLLTVHWMSETIKVISKQISNFL